MAMKVKKINLAVLSDIHLGHKRNSTSEIIKNLRVAVADDASTAQLDIIFLAGDVFDDLLLLNDDDVYEIDLWIYHLLTLCAKYGIKLRVLEGTPRHDRLQSNRFVLINEVMGHAVDLKWVTKISVEHIEEFGLDVLYIPDEATESPEKTLRIAKEVMAARGLEQVDLAIMHGCFDYQIPYLASDHKHDSNAYLEMVKYLIFIGHVHTSSTLARIIAQGSFDRLSHGQEEPKGHYRATLYNSGEWEANFVENTGAKKFVTLKCQETSLEETLVEINELVQTLPPYSHIRLDLDRDHPLLASTDTLIRRWPLITWEKIVRDTGEEELIAEPEIEDEYKPIQITRDNIVEMMMNRIMLHPDIEADLIDVVREQLEKVVS